MTMWWISRISGWWQQSIKANAHRWSQPVLLSRWGNRGLDGTRRCQVIADECWHSGWNSVPGHLPLLSLLGSLFSGFSCYRHHHDVAAGGHRQGCEWEGLLLPLFFSCLTLASFLSYLHTWAFLHTVIPHCWHDLFHWFSWRLWGEGSRGAGGVKSKKGHFADWIALLGAMPERMYFFPLSSPPFPNPNIDEILRASLNVFAQAASGQAPGQDAGY